MLLLCHNCDKASYSGIGICSGTHWYRTLQSLEVTTSRGSGGMCFPFKGDNPKAVSYFPSYPHRQNFLSSFMLVELGNTVTICVAMCPIKGWLIGE